MVGTSRHACTSVGLGGHAVCHVPDRVVVAAADHRRAYPDLHFPCRHRKTMPTVRADPGICPRHARGIQFGVGKQPTVVSRRCAYRGVCDPDGDRWASRHRHTRPLHVPAGPMVRSRRGRIKHLRHLESVAVVRTNGRFGGTMSAALTPRRLGIQIDPQLKTLIGHDRLRGWQEITPGRLIGGASIAADRAFDSGWLPTRRRR